MFCYYLLGGDTVAPSELYARLCHAFLVQNSFTDGLTSKLAIKSLLSIAPHFKCVDLFI